MSRWFWIVGLTAAVLAQDVPPRNLTLADNHKTFQLVMGQKVTLRLPVNPTAGFAWELHYKNSQLKPLASKPTYTPTDPKKPKLGGSLSYTWQVAGEFDDSLELRYLRSQAKKPKPLRVYTVHLRSGAPSP